MYKCISLREIVEFFIIYAPHLFLIPEKKNKNIIEDMWIEFPICRMQNERSTIEPMSPL